MYNFYPIVQLLSQCKLLSQCITFIPVYNFYPSVQLLSQCKLLSQCITFIPVYNFYPSVQFLSQLELVSGVLNLLILVIIFLMIISIFGKLDRIFVCSFFLSPTANFRLKFYFKYPTPLSKSFLS